VALLLALRGEVDESLALLNLGESQVEAMPEEHAMFLCKKGQICHLMADPAGARGALAQAQEIVAALEVADDSEVSRFVAGLWTLLSAREGR
jgi:hypothetical protein